MVRITIFLLFLLLRSNVYAYCYATQWSTYGPVYSSLGVTDGTTMQACQALACQLYPYIPECGYTVSQPTCTAQVEYQTLACPVHQSGAINQSRTYDCTAQTWGVWTTTSNNCTQDPPTCIESSETRQVACPAGYEGYIQEQRNSLCSDPYGSPTWTSWSTILDTCKMTTTNINNPVSPISPISPTNPNSVLSTTSSTTMTQDIGSVQEVTTSALVQETATITTDTSVSLTTTSSTSSSTTASTTTTSSTQSSSNTSSSSNTTSTVQTTVPKGKEIVPGFGIVMSMQLLNSAQNMQQAQMQEYINLEQENEYGRTQEFSLSLLSETAVADRFDTLNRSRWANLLRNYPLQRLEWGD